MLKDLKEKLNRTKEIYFQVKIRPNASKSLFKAVLEENDNPIYKVDIAAAPIQGKANQELIKFLAKEFSVDKNSVKIINGAGNRLKLIHVII